MKRGRLLLAVIAVFSLLLGLVPAASAQEADTSLPAVHRGANLWLLRESLTPGPATIQFRYGSVEDEPMFCDWDGNGTRTPGVARPLDNGRWQWLLRNSNTSGPAEISFVYGRWDFFDFPICGDWNDNGTQTAGVMREPETTGALRWLLRNENASGAADISFNYGRMTDPEDFPFPMVGDWSGDGVDTPGLIWFRATTLQWQLRAVNAAGPADFDFRYGRSELDFPVVGDWNGDDTDTVGVQRDRGTGAGGWLLRNSLTAGPAEVEFNYGRIDDFPLVWR